MSAWKRGEEISCNAVQLGDNLMVETDAGDVPVVITAPGSWGLVHGQIDMPGRRLDTSETVLVALDIKGGTIHRAAQA